MKCWKEILVFVVGCGVSPLFWYLSGVPFPEKRSPDLMFFVIGTPVLGWLMVCFYKLFTIWVSFILVSRIYLK